MRKRKLVFDQQSRASDINVSPLI
ncbi:MAG TPA: biopolymer transporter ExbD, partial [Verrucomicrobiales bacterium]|nr:biopolymer transporter ExbD [Verrucomicrobiales bacterium]HCZ05429.1 biopolymer transporter ExbD [Verrucomicrobiales bacterium]